MHVSDIQIFYIKTDVIHFLPKVKVCLNAPLDSMYIFKICLRMSIYYCTICKRLYYDECDSALVSKKFWAHVKSKSNNHMISETVSYGARFRKNMKDQSQLFMSIFTINYLLLVIIMLKLIFKMTHGLLLQLHIRRQVLF